MNFMCRLVFFVFLCAMQLLPAIDTSILTCLNPIENGERRIVVVIASYNNQKWYQRNLDSVFSQKYRNYRVIYIDDCSSDGTADLVEQYVKEKERSHRFLLIKNDVRSYKMANTYRAYHMCNDTDVIIELDGDDWLMHDQVFTRYNQIYADPNVWMTYGHFMEWPTNAPQIMSEIENEVIQTNSFRKKEKCCFWAGLRTYYAWLVKQIALKDCMFKGTFLTMTSDTAIMLPMFEMAGNRYAFLTEMMLEHNVATSFNDHKVDGALQFEACCHVLALEPYKKLPEPIIKAHDYLSNACVDLYLYSHKTPDQLARLLESLSFVSGWGRVTVIYNVSDGIQVTAYEKIFNQYPFVLPMLHMSGSKLGEILLSKICNDQSDYCLIAEDSFVFKSTVDLKKCIKWLDQTKAHAFSLAVNEQCMAKNKYVPLEDEVLASQFFYGGKTLQNTFAVTMAVYRTQDIRRMCQNSPLSFGNSFTRLFLDTMKNSLMNVVLFFKDSPINLITKRDGW